jgi:hypothetical protein
MFFQKTFIAVACLVLAAGGTARASDLTEAATAAEAALAAQDFEAWSSATAALDDAVWTAGGLYIDEVVATLAPATGFGLYDARPDGPYAPGEPIYLYVQPKGYGYGDAGGGVNEIAFDIDLQIQDPSGEVLLEQKDFMQFVVNTRAKARELMVTLTTSLDGAPAGDYAPVYTLRDRHSDQQASFTHNISIQ